MRGHLCPPFYLGRDTSTLLFSHEDTSYLLKVYTPKMRAYALFLKTYPDLLEYKGRTRENIIQGNISEKITKRGIKR